VSRRFRPLDRVTSIKRKLSVVIVAAVGVVVAVQSLGLTAGAPLAVVAALSLVLALAVIHVLARGMTYPLREMAEAARAMAAGSYSQRVTATSRDEVGELARAFNAMAAELDELDRLRRDFVAHASHELRTPIGALRALLENLVDGVGAADEVTLRELLGHVERLGRLSSQLLDLSRLESGAAPLERRTFPLLPLLEAAAATSRVSAAERGVRILVDLDPGSLRLHADPERLHQVATNLLENAVRHSPRGGSVELRAGLANRSVRIEVADEGSGIPAPDRSRVFERFYRADSARSGADGAGLGLAIVKWIVDLHGGTIEVHGNRPQGCRMVLMLPGGASG